MVSKYKVYAVNIIDLSEKKTSGEVEPVLIVAEKIHDVVKLETKDKLITDVVLALSILEDGSKVIDINVIVNQKDVDEEKPLKAYFTDEDSGNIFVSEKPPIYPKDTYSIILEKEVALFIPAEEVCEYSNETKAE